MSRAAAANDDWSVNGIGSGWTALFARHVKVLLQFTEQDAQDQIKLGRSMAALHSRKRQRWWWRQLGQGGSASSGPSPVQLAGGFLFLADDQDLSTANERVWVFRRSHPWACNWGLSHCSVRYQVLCHISSSHHHDALSRLCSFLPVEITQRVFQTMT